jgi:prolyl-tRNA synthetase
MKLSQYFVPTHKEIPQDAEIISHQLMLRAGLIRKLGSGLYTWLPLGLKVLRKIETIVREELNNAGALEILMPAVQPAELWQESERWDTFGPLLLKMTDRGKREFCFGPTHEEVITDLTRKELKSYKQLPLNLYQIQTKFRDEIRPRFGVMRAREFIMKDAYSFHTDKTCLAETYQKMHTAYSNVFTRLGLTFRAVDADTGSIGGSASHEFQVLADNGEDLIFYSDQSDYAANIEKASYYFPAPVTEGQIQQSRMQLVDTPNVKTIQDVVNYLDLPIEKTIKTLLVEGNETEAVALVLRGDHILNELKAEKHALVKSPLTFIEEDKANALTNSVFGSLGPVELELPILVDHSAAALEDFCCGANQIEKHLTNCNWHIDAKWTELADLRNVVEGDISPDGKGHLSSARGIEVGHIFQLGTKYSQAMNASVLNDQGKAVPIEMGCYGLGISRVVAAAIEQHHDENGIIWPKPLAPFDITLLPMNMHKSEKVKAFTEELYQKLTAQGFDVLLDDRNERAGVMFADSDLIGIPHRIVIGEKSLNNEMVEYKSRKTNEKKDIPLSELDSFISEL